MRLELMVKLTLACWILGAMALLRLMAETGLAIILVKYRFEFKFISLLWPFVTLSKIIAFLLILDFRENKNGL